MLVNYIATGSETDRAHAAKLRLSRIAHLFFARKVPNTTRAHRAAIRRLWTPKMAAEFGSPPDPTLLVIVRANMATTNIHGCMTINRHLGAK